MKVSCLLANFEAEAWLEVGRGEEVELEELVDFGDFLWPDPVLAVELEEVEEVEFEEAEEVFVELEVETKVATEALEVIVEVAETLELVSLAASVEEVMVELVATLEVCITLSAAEEEEEVLEEDSDPICAIFDASSTAWLALTEATEETEPRADSMIPIMPNSPSALAFTWGVGWARSNLLAAEAEEEEAIDEDEEDLNFELDPWEDEDEEELLAAWIDEVVEALLEELEDVKRRDLKGSVAKLTEAEQSAFDPLAVAPSKHPKAPPFQVQKTSSSLIVLLEFSLLCRSGLIVEVGAAEEGWGNLVFPHLPPSPVFDSPAWPLELVLSTSLADFDGLPACDNACSTPSEIDSSLWSRGENWSAMRVDWKVEPSALTTSPETEVWGLKLSERR